MGETHDFGGVPPWEDSVESPGILDVDAVIKVMQQDEEFVAATPEGPPLEVFRAFVATLPQALGYSLQYDLTVETLFQAKAAVAQQMINFLLVEKLTGAYPEELSNQLPMTPSALGHAANLALHAIIEALSGLLEAGVPAFLESRGCMSERMFLRSADGANLCEEAEEALEAGELTIARLLEIQPSVLLKND